MKKYLLTTISVFAAGMISFGQYCTASFTSVTFEHITNVTFADINNSTAGVVPNNDFTAQVANVSPGQVVPISVTILNGGTEYIFAFFDWNQNGVLNDAGEVYTVLNGANAPGPHTININVPPGAAIGTTRMRVIMQWSNATPNPCISATYGEVEDYTVNVQGDGIFNIENVSCYGQATGSMTALFSSGVPPISYSWNNGDTTSVITNLTAGEYCVTMVDASMSTLVVCDTIFDLASSALGIYAHTPGEWICTDSMGLLVIDSITGGVPDMGAYTYSWNNGSSMDSTWVLSGNWVLTVEDSVNCMDSITIVLNESAPINVDDMDVCQGNPADLASTPGFDSYMWNTGETTDMITIMTGGTYYVDAVDSLGCMTSDTAWVTTIPSPVLAASTDMETFGMDGAIYLSIYGSAYPFTVDWDNDGTGDNDDNENLYYLFAGDYTVVVTDTNGCYTTLTVTVASQVGLENSVLSLFQIYPNPSNGLVYIQPQTGLGENVTGSLVDASGRVIRNITFNGDQLVTIDLSNYDRGVYFINLIVDGEIASAKIILQ